MFHNFYHKTYFNTNRLKVIDEDNIYNAVYACATMFVVTAFSPVSYEIELRLYYFGTFFAIT